MHTVRLYFFLTNHMYEVVLKYDVMVPDMRSACTSYIYLISCLYNQPACLIIFVGMMTTAPIITQPFFTRGQTIWLSERGTMGHGDTKTMQGQAHLDLFRSTHTSIRASSRPDRHQCPTNLSRDTQSILGPPQIPINLRF
jgi:hypothetical protein